MVIKTQFKQTKLAKISDYEYGASFITMTYLKKNNVQQYLFINASKYIDPRQKGLN